MKVEEINQKLLELGNPTIAEHSKRFFKTGIGEYGYGDKFLGIRVPILRKLCKDHKQISLDNTVKLLKSKYHEIRLFALFILVEKFNLNDELKDEIYQLYLSHTQYINSWDLVDSSAHKIMGAYLLERDKKILYKLAKSSSLWERRIAVITTFYFIKKDIFNPTLEISERLLSDREDLIHKAVGWMLRELGKRDGEIEREFLSTHIHEMPRTMLRYAIEKFDIRERKKWLNFSK